MGLHKEGSITSSAKQNLKEKIVKGGENKTGTSQNQTYHPPKK